MYQVLLALFPPLGKIHQLAGQGRGIIQSLQGGIKQPGGDMSCRKLHASHLDIAEQARQQVIEIMGNATGKDAEVSNLFSWVCFSSASLRAVTS